MFNHNAQEVNELIARLSKEGRKSEIQTELAKLKKDFIPREISYVEGTDFDDYIHDMKITQKYASMNREEMVDILLDFFKRKNNNLEITQFETIHNYIDTDTMILRKGAISANEGERMIIPLNMRDGCIIAIGKGNEDWNNSAPHGAGRVLSRKRAKEQISLDKFRESMKGIWTSSVSKDTLDESPMTYKPAKSIISNIGDTVEIEKIIKPVYNFKAKE
ncbi:MAG: RtcB family protein [Sarcina sp.]